MPFYTLISHLLVRTETRNKSEEKKAWSLGGSSPCVLTCVVTTWFILFFVYVWMLSGTTLFVYPAERTAKHKSPKLPQVGQSSSTCWKYFSSIEQSCINASFLTSRLFCVCACGIGFPGPKTAPAATGNKSKKKKTAKATTDDTTSEKSEEEQEDHRTPSQIEEDHILERFSAARRRKGV